VNRATVNIAAKYGPDCGGMFSLLKSVIISMGKETSALGGQVGPFAKNGTVV
jgi:hypothetical protein